MTNEQIEHFLAQKKIDKTPVQINFKTRSSILGLFIQTSDYAELKSKNLWRIVGGNSIAEFQKSNDLSLARIFNGVEFTRLVVVTP